MFTYQNFSLHKKQILSDDRSRATLIAEIIKNGLVTIMLEGKGRDLRNFIQMQVAHDLSSIRLYRPNGEIIASSIPSDEGMSINDLQPGLILTEKHDFSLNQVGSLSIYGLVMPIFNEKPCQKCHGTTKNILGTLSVSIPMDKTLQNIRRLREQLIFYYSIAIVLTMLTLLILLNRFASDLSGKPLAAINSAIRRFTKGDSDARVPLQKDEEFNDLADAVNLLLEQLSTMGLELKSRQDENRQKDRQMVSIEEFAGAIAHEIKNPLAGISGAIQVFAEDFPPEDSRREIIAEIQNEVDRLDKSVKNLLSYARLPEFNFITTSIDPVLERAVEIMDKQIQTNAVSVNITMDEGLPEFRYDPTLMQQVFINLIQNAVQAMPDGGMLNITVKTDPASSNVIISFSDTGHGISKTNHENIFKPFFTTRTSGIGLGLAICKNVVEQHNGSITVKSTMGVGSTLRLTLPVREENV